MRVEKSEIVCRGKRAILTGYIREEIQARKGRKRPAVIICPGGAYERCSDREAEPAAVQFLAMGSHCFILDYSIKDAPFPTALLQLAKTVAYLRTHAQEMELDEDQITVCGFSAGGHVAASLGTMWNDPELLKVYDNQDGKNRPNAMILLYPVITADQFAHQLSIKLVSGCEPGTPGYEYFSLDKRVSQDTCPAFLWHSMEDGVVPVENSIQMMTALHNAGVAVEAHFFPHGMHGTSACTEETFSRDDYNARWMDLALTWLDNTFGYHL